MKRDFRSGFPCLAPDAGAEGEGAGNTKVPDPKDAELEALKAQMADEKAKREEVEKKLADSEKEKLTEEQRRDLEAKQLHDASVAKLRALQAKALGIDEAYIDLIKGNTDEEIEKSANLLAAALKKTAEETETKVKKDVAFTGAPGASAKQPETAQDPADFYRGILKEQMGK